MLCDTSGFKNLLRTWGKVHFATCVFSEFLASLIFPVCFFFFFNICGTVVEENEKHREIEIRFLGTLWPISRLREVEISVRDTCHKTAGFHHVLLVSVVSWVSMESVIESVMLWYFWALHCIFDQKGLDICCLSPNFRAPRLPFYTTIYRKNEIWMPGGQGKKGVEISGGPVPASHFQPLRMSLTLKFAGASVKKTPLYFPTSASKWSPVPSRRYFAAFTWSENLKKCSLLPKTCWCPKGKSSLSENVSWFNNFCLKKQRQVSLHLSDLEMNWTSSFLVQSDKLAIVLHLLLAPVATVVKPAEHEVAHRLSPSPGAVSRCFPQNRRSTLCSVGGRTLLVFGEVHVILVFSKLLGLTTCEGSGALAKCHPDVPWTSAGFMLAERWM